MRDHILSYRNTNVKSRVTKKCKIPSEVPPKNRSWKYIRDEMPSNISTKFAVGRYRELNLT